MPMKVPKLKTLPFVEENSETVLKVEELVRFLRKHVTERDKAIRIDNLKLELSKKKELRTVDANTFVTFQGVIVYIFNHINDYAICQNIAAEISKVLCGKTDDSPKSILELYRDIANVNFLQPFGKIALNENNLQTLHINYKANFSENEWEKICRFEYQFSRKNPEILDFEETFSRKSAFLNRLKKICEIGQHVNRDISEFITENEQRKEASEIINGETVKLNNIIHTYNGLRQSVEKYQEYIFKEKPTVTVTECLPSQCINHTNGVHAFVECKAAADFGSLEEQATLVRSDLNKTHGVVVPEIIFLEENTLNEYSCKQCTNDNYHKFHLRDDYFSGKLGNKIVHVLHEYDEDYIDLLEPKTLKHQDDDNKVYCEYCFQNISSHIFKPLDWKHFDLLKEWYLEVPLELQTIFGNLFINKDTLRRSDCSEGYLFTRIGKLYCLLDSGFNISNRKYHGILQQMNTEELIVNYHSISTVFDVTTQSGITKSLKSATRWLQARSDLDKRYYDAYLKHYPLEHKDPQGEVSKMEVCMRDCYNIVYLDNLVRWSIHADPDPGKNRTSQICTLPITIKGLPKQSYIIKSWHQQDCDLLVNCNCMQQIKLGKDQCKLLLEYEDKEKEALQILDVQTRLGIGLLVPALKTLISECTDIFNQDIEDENILDISKELGNLDISMEATWLADIDTSMRSMKLDDYVDEDEPDDQNGINLDNLDESDEFLDDIIEEEDFFEGIQPLDISTEEHPQELTEDQDETPIENLIENMSTNTNDGTVPVNNVLTRTTFNKFEVPPLLCRHPTPAQGRDDDINHLKDILLDILTKLGRYPGKEYKERILFAPDHKIAKNLLQLIRTDKIFKQFLPEFPVLHLKKSKITNLFTAYKDAGVLHLLKYMKDSDNDSDLTDVTSVINIEAAAKNIKRLTLALNLAFLISFMQHLDKPETMEFLKDFELNDMSLLHKKWYSKLDKFMEKGRDNATFALHEDLLKHCTEILGISIAERIGGIDGYNLLLGCVKSSLPFAFLNGASSYASFCVDLLHVHYTSGVFHTNMKQCLFTTPHKNSNVNFALDAQREMDHLDAVKGFRPRSTIDAVIPRMSIVDHFTDVQQFRQELNKSDVNETVLSQQNKTDDGEKSVYNLSPNLNFDISSKDLKFIIPVAKLITRVGALSLKPDSTPRNVYNPTQPALPESLLDKNSYEAGRFLVKKYACQQKIFEMSNEDLPGIETVEGSKNLIQRLKAAKGVTLRRSTIKSKIMTEDQKKEAKRVAHVKKQNTIADCISSDMNTCQAVVKPDCSKASLQKSTGIKKALKKVISHCIPYTDYSQLDVLLANRGLVFLDINEVPLAIRQSITKATVEFAGVKFKTKATSGEEYLSHVTKGVIGRLLKPSHFPNMNRIVICEEKYSFTPDDFKAATRVKRQKTSATSISHLKLESRILSDDKMSKSALIQTELGKRLISNYLARNLQNLDIKSDIIVDIDSELVLNTSCLHTEGDCSCPYKSYSTPIRGTFSKVDGFLQQQLLHHIKQRKGEAEMSQVDWLDDMKNELLVNDAIVSVVTSADIDSIVIHLFSLSLFWPRDESGSFKNKVYVLLQKQKSELYDITGIIELLESRFSRKSICTIAISLCLGGNDFIPKYQGISHEKWLSVIIDTPGALQNLVHLSNEPASEKPTGILSEDLYLEIVKRLYCPQNINSELLSLDEVRQISIKPPGKPIRHPKLWMPPKSALKQVLKLINCQIAYLLTTWKHDAVLPDFQKDGCLRKDASGNVHYHFGKDARIEKIEDQLCIDEKVLKGKMDEASSCTKRKRIAGTPVKNNRRKRRPIMSTPVKMKSNQDQDHN